VPEAEWEYTCRAWTSSRYSYGDDLDYASLTDYCWFGGDARAETQPAGQKLPNPWGLYDMHGNVLERCQDWYGAYPGGLALDPQSPPTGTYRVIRGGYWFHYAWIYRSAFRAWLGPDSKDHYGGFRLVLAPGPI
jgi:formylglycine-generating enzyme required for sulfatase activity